MGDPATVALLAALATSVAAAGLIAPVLALLRASGNMDVPNHRSSHAISTPRGAGLALIPALLIGSVVAASLGEAPAWVVVGGAAALALLGVLDDFFGLRPAVRLAVQLFAGLTVVIALSADWNLLLLATAVTAVVGYVNAFNFMDGINGISGFHAVVVGAAFAALGIHFGLPPVAILGAIVFGLGLGFLPWNVPHAKVFLGDSGSYLLGALIAGTAIVAVASGMPIVWAVAPLWIYLVDTTAVLVRHVVTGTPVMEAHRDHVYQRLTDRLGSHVRAALLVATFSAVPPVLLLATDSVRVAIPLSLVGAAIYLALPIAVGRVSAWGL